MKICFWNSETGQQDERDATPEEIAQSDADAIAAAIPRIADSIPMLNLQLILINDDKLTSAEAIINGMEGDEGARARAYWRKALTARRDNYLVNEMWPALGYDLAGFNDAWARAAALNP